MLKKDLKNSYLKYQLKEIYRNAYLRIFKKRFQEKKYAGKGILSISEGNALLKKHILSGEPYMVTRYGANELSMVTDEITKGTIKPFHMQRMWEWSGFFPNELLPAKKFVDITLQLSAQVGMAALYYAKGEEFVLANFAKDANLVHNRAIEPWYTPEKPWTAALKGKKVLIIHPFDETIKEQYKKRELLFPETEILPEFELLTLKAVQTVAGQKDERFATWFDALDYMYDEAKKIDFDVAIIGCGAYGMPLAAKIKLAGKQAVHLGGATQLLFGIKGARWDNHPVISKLYNDSWVRPNASERPKNSNKVEGGCYW